MQWRGLLLFIGLFFIHRAHSALTDIKTPLHKLLDSTRFFIAFDLRFENCVSLRKCMRYTFRYLTLEEVEEFLKEIAKNAPDSVKLEVY